MKKRIIFTLLLVFLICFSGYANLYINEVNSTGKWIEIYNSGDNNVNIGGYFVARNNNDGASAAAVIPSGTIITSKGFIVIYQGSASPSPVEGAIDCMPYGISADKFMNAILKDDKGYVVDESFDIDDPQTVTVSGGKSWARETDGAATIVALDPTPGKANNSSPSFSGLKIYVNEVNPTGKWIEFFNDEDVDVNMEGYTLTRSNYDGTSVAILPAGITITSKGFLVIYQEGNEIPVEGAIECLPFGISADRFMIALLKDNQGLVVDNTFVIGNPPETTQWVTVCGEQSWARETDGAETIVALNPTPGKSNTTPPTYSELKIYINEVNSTGKWIELYNDEEFEINVGGYIVTRNNNDCAVGKATIPAGTTIKSKGFLVIYQGNESGGSAPSPVDGAVDCLSYGISSDKFMNAILTDNQGRIVDNTFDIGNPQMVAVSDGKSWSRETDGAATVVALDPTPGVPNSMFTGLISEIFVSDYIPAILYAGTLKLPDNTSSVQLYSVSGNLVLNGKVTATSIDLTNLPKGFYVVKMTISGKIFTQKIVL